MGPLPNERMHKRPVGAGLSLDKFATLGVSKFDKRKKIERLRKEKLIQHSKYSKLKKKLEAQGVLSVSHVKDSVAELEALDGNGTSEEPEEAHHNAARSASHAQAGPRGEASQRGATARNGPQRGAHVNDAAAAAPRGHRAALAAKQHGSAPSLAAHSDSDRDQDDAHETRQQHAAGRKRPHAGGSLAEARQPAGQAKAARRESQGPPGRPDRAVGNKSGAGRVQRDVGGGGSPDETDGGQHEGRGTRGGAGPRSRGPEGGEGRGGKKLSRLQRLAQKVAEEKAEKQREKEAAMKERQERLRRVAAVEKARKQDKQLHFKRNAKGQPLMRYRMDKLLSKIQGEA